MKRSKVLLLNADYTPEKLLDWRTAIIQDIIHTKNSAFVVCYYDDWVILDSSRRQYRVPAVMALRKYVPLGNRSCPYTKSNVYARDLMICQYCENRFPKFDLTVDHVMPISRWRKSGIKNTASCFENVVTACKRCNSVKGDKTPEEANMKLMKKPRAITRREAFSNKILLMDNIPNEWQPYLQGILSGKTN